MKQRLLCENPDGWMHEEIVGDILLTYNNMEGNEWEDRIQHINQNAQIIVLVSKVDTIESQLRIDNTKPSEAQAKLVFFKKEEVHV